MKSMEEVIRFYNYFGLKLSDERRIPPDHLATELEFLHYLTFRQAASKLRIGIGLHTGPIVAGNLGSRRRMDYTGIGGKGKAAGRPEDGAGAVLERLSEEHESELERAAALVELRRSPAPIRGAGADPAAAQGLFAFAEGLRRHLAWENKIVLPLARRRLRRADLALIGRGMARRRDIDFPE